MLLGKRPRHPLKRTTSMTEFSFDDLTIHHHPPPSAAHNNGIATVDHHRDQKMTSLVSPRHLNNNRRNLSLDFVSESCSNFLRTCSLCNRRLAPGRDIYMYRGDTAFCSLECRQQQMTQDEWREKCCLLESNSSSHSSTAGTSVSSTQPETVAAL